jgi:hypothetical protein
MSDPNERAAYVAELRAAERAEAEQIKAEFIRKLEALYDKAVRAAFRTEVEQLKAEFIRKLEALYDKHTELAHLAAEPVRDAPPLFRRKPPVQRGGRSGLSRVATTAPFPTGNKTTALPR